MTFRPDAELDPEQVRDVRGRRGGAIAVGEGGIGIVIVAHPSSCCWAATQALLNGAGGPITGQQQPAPIEGPRPPRPAAPAPMPTPAPTAASWGTSTASAVLAAIVRSVRAALPLAKTCSSAGAEQSGCGTASAATGPFYCPPDTSVYLDLEFFVSCTRGSARAAAASPKRRRPRYGHHIENLTGVLDRAGNGGGATGGSVRIELMADCLAGLWAAHAQSTKLLGRVTRDDINQALDAAAAVEDDRIQKSTSGRVNPESWTHGSSEQRQRWTSRATSGAWPPAARSPPSSRAVARGRSCMSRGVRWKMRPR
ncbi:MAG: neutral zinc metallopeptidase [Dehalococcoidia bacterium]